MKKNNISKKKVIICISVALALILALVLTLVLALRNDDKSTTTTTTTTGKNGLGIYGEYPYPHINITEYCNMTPDTWANIAVTLKQSDYVVTDQDVTDYMQALQAQHLENCPTYTKITNRPIQNGDAVYIYYTGYIDGVSFAGGSNRENQNAHRLVIGSQSFIEGFEEGLVGVVPESTSATLRTEGVVAENEIVYFTYYCRYTDHDGNPISELDYTQQRIDLSNVSASYGKDFTDYLVGQPLGSQIKFSIFDDFDGDGQKECKYYDGQVVKAGTEQTVKVEATFPSPYVQKMELSGKTATFEVVVEYIEEEHYPEITSEFITETLKYTPKTEDPVKEYLAYIRTSLEEQMTVVKEEHITSKMMDVFLEKLNVIKYPEGLVEYYYNDLYEQFEQAYAEDKYYFELSYGTAPFDDIGEYIVYYYQLENVNDGVAWLLTYCQNQVKLNMIPFYIGHALGYTVSDAEINNYAKMLADSMNEQYGSTSITVDDVLAHYGKDYIHCAVMYDKVTIYCRRHTTVTYE